MIRRHIHAAHLTSTLLAVVLVVVSGCSGSGALEREAAADRAMAQHGAPARDGDRESALTLFIQGSIEESKGNPHGAIAAYSEALTHDEDATIHFALARTYSQIGNAANALVSARRAVTLAPRDVQYRDLLLVLYMSTRQFDSAAIEGEALLRIDPAHANARFTLAYLEAQKNPARALDLCEGLLTEFGPNPELLDLAGQLYMATEQYARGIERFEALRESDRANLEIAAALTEFYVKTGTRDKLLALHRELAGTHPGDPGVLLTSASVFVENHEWDAGSALIRRAIAADSTGDETLKHAAFLYAMIPDSIAAPAVLPVLDTLCRRHPDDTVIRSYRARIHFERGALDAAIADARAVLELEPRDLFALDLLARAHLTAGRFAEAIAPLQTIIDTNEGSADTWSWLGFALGRVGDEARSEQALRHALMLDSTRMDAISTLALAYDSRREFTRSDSLYERALALYRTGTIERDANYYLLCNNYAYTLAERRQDLDRAQRLAEEAVEHEDENSSYLDTIGWVHFRRGEHERALTYVRKAIRLRNASGAPVGAVLFDHLGDILTALGRTSEAADAWRQALHEDPTSRSIQDKLSRITP